MEGSFAAAANHHGFKRARWRRLHNQRIQDYLIAACQNIRIFMRHGRLKPAAAMAAVENQRATTFYALVVLAQHPSNFRDHFEAELLAVAREPRCIARSNNFLNATNS